MNITENTVTIRVQGVTQEIDATAFHQDAINAIFTYGLRRWFQDHINSAAKSKRDADEEVTPKWVTESIAARLDQAVSGEITMRNGEPVDPLDEYRIKVLRRAMKIKGNEDLKAAYDAIDSSDQKGRREYLLSVAAAHADTVDKAAKEWQAEDAKKADKLSGLSFKVA